MTQRPRILIAIGIALIALIAILYATSQIILGQSFATLEEQDTRQNVQRAQDALSNNLAALNSKTGDWANWDDAYAFVQDGNSDFIKTNITDNSFLQLHINLILFIQPTGAIVFDKAVDLDAKVETAVPAALQAYFADPRARERLLQNRDPASSLTGILLLPEGPLLIAARPILTSEGQGPIRGTLIFGRYLDAAEIARLAETTHLSLSIYPFDAPQMPADFLSARLALSDPASLFIQPLSETSVAGYARLNDIFNQPALVLRVKLAREVYQQGQATIRYLMFWVIGIALVFGIVSQLTLDRLVLSRRERHESEERYRAVIEQAVEGIFLLDAQTKCVIEANAAFRNLLGYSPEEIAGMSIYDIIAHDRTDVDFLHQIVAQRRYDASEQRHRRKDGSLVDVEATASVIAYGGREVICAVSRDVTERKQAEAERARLFEQEQTRRAELTALYALSRALADASNFDAILNLVVRHAVETIHVTFARVLLIENTDLVLRAGYPIRLLDRDLQVGRREHISEYPFCQRLLAQDTPVVVRADTAEIDDYEHAMLFLYLARSLCLVPLRAGERAFGLLLLGEARHEERECFSPEKTRLARSISEQAANALRRAELFDELERAYFQTVLALARAVDAKDTYTADHAERLAEMALAIGRELEMTPRELEDLRYGAILHDIGKIGVPDAILLKPAKLDKEEWKRVRQHPAIGAQILAPLPRLAGAAKIVRHHHERYDGAGYPDGLAGDAIPLGARVLTVVDSYSAIIDKRVYKEARPHEDALAELKRCAGAQFDSRIVEVFLFLIDNKPQLS